MTRQEYDFERHRLSTDSISGSVISVLCLFVALLEGRKFLIVAFSGVAIKGMPQFLRDDCHKLKADECGLIAYAVSVFVT